MQEVVVSWDSLKAQSNFDKHGVRFDEAQTVFDDPNARLIHDPDHSLHEERFLLLGMSLRLRLLIVVHAYRQHDSEIRIISARKATKREQEQYGELL